jgi:hypothetical protein
MKFNHLALVMYAVITTIFILGLEWGVNLPYPEFSRSTRLEYQQISFFNGCILPLVGALLAVTATRAINRYRFHMPEVTATVLVCGLLFIVLKPALIFASSTGLALFAAVVGMIIMFYLYQATSHYFRKSATI